MLVYYLIAWWRVGRDPSAGPIIPNYRPALPPAAMRFIRRMRFDETCLSAAVISLAVKKHLVIREVSSTPVLLLPYGIALDVETEWTDQFSRAIRAARARGEDDRYLSPAWYSRDTSSGRIGSMNGLRNIGSSLGSAISTATAPRSGGSGGSSGGGSTGGGGGGGGGW